MNLSNEDNSLQLLKYLPDMSSHYMLQPTESLDLGQLPGLCDDLLTNGLDLSTGWTVGNLTLPILLSTPTITDTDRSITETTTLGINGTLFSHCPVNTIQVEPLEKSKTNITLDKYENNTLDNKILHLENSIVTLEDENNQKPIQALLSDTVIPTNKTVIFTKIQETNPNVRIIKRKAPAKTNKQLKKLKFEKDQKRQTKKKLPNTTIQIPSNNKTIKTITIPSNSLVKEEFIEICNEVNISELDNNFLINPVTIDTKLRNESSININDVATVITAYQCKICSFSCNDENLFLEHYNDTHKNGETENLIIKNSEEADEFIINEDVTTSDLEINVKPELLNQETSESPVLLALYLPGEENFVLDKRKSIIINSIDKTDEIINENTINIVKMKNDKDVLQIEETGSEDEGVHLYICSQCGQGGFESIDTVRNHMIEIHKLQSLDETQKFITEPPTQIVVSAEEIKKRNKIAIDKFLTADVLKSRKNKCTVKGCQYRFAKSELLARHINCHVDGVKNQFRCPECNENFQAWRVCSMHLWNCHRLDLDLYTCPLCDYRTTTPMKLTVHLKIHSDDKEFACPDCGRRFKQASQMRNHRVIHLDKELHGIPKWYAQKHCDKCGKDFADAKCLKKHVQAVHSRLKPFICNVCGHSCARKAMLEMHVRQHTGEKPYACQSCYYRTGDHNSLRRHLMRHSGERPYKCPHCTYTAIQSNSYKNHLASKHPGMAGIFNCNICNFRCVNEELFTSHLNEHEKGLIDKTGKRPPPNTINIDKTKTLSVDSILTSDTNSSKSSEDDRPETSITAFKAAKNVDTEDDETQHFLSSLGLREDHTIVDTGGITIPADP